MTDRILILLSQWRKRASINISVRGRTVPFYSFFKDIYVYALPNPYEFPIAKSNFSLKSRYETCSGNLRQLTHVLATGNIGVEEKSSSSFWMNWMEGVGEKPIGGSTDAPVAKANIFWSLDGPSSSIRTEKHCKW